MESRTQALWERHPGLVWSNRHAGDKVMIANALLRPHFDLLLDIAAVFGLADLQARWQELRRDIAQSGDPSDLNALRRAEPTVERCLRHMEAAREAA